MSEPDWRTVSKAVYLFHSILRDLPVEHHAILKIFLGKVFCRTCLRSKPVEGVKIFIGKVLTQATGSGRAD